MVFCCPNSENRLADDQVGENSRRLPEGRQGECCNEHHEGDCVCTGAVAGAAGFVYLVAGIVAGAAAVLIKSVVHRPTRAGER